MKFRDTKLVKYEGYSFAHARILQGVIIYIVILGLLILGMIDKQKSAYLILTLIAIAYICAMLYYMHKGKKIAHATKLALLRIITLPTSMLG